jgi:hypothetical protein
VQVDTLASMLRSAGLEEIDVIADGDRYAERKS